MGYRSSIVAFFQEEVGKWACGEAQIACGCPGRVAGSSCNSVSIGHSLPRPAWTVESALPL